MVTMRSGADGLQTMCRWRVLVRTTYAHVQMTHGRCADDVQMMAGAVLHKIRQLRQEQLCIKPKMASLFIFFLLFLTVKFVANRLNRTVSEWHIALLRSPEKVRTTVEVFANNITLTMLIYLSILCFNLREIIGCVRHISFLSVVNNNTSIWRVSLLKMLTDCD